MENASKYQPRTHGEEMRMLERVQQGFHCSEILLFAGLEAQARSIRTLSRLSLVWPGALAFPVSCAALLRWSLSTRAVQWPRGREWGPRPALNIMVANWWTGFRRSSEANTAGPGAEKLFKTIHGISLKMP